MIKIFMTVFFLSLLLSACNLARQDSRDESNGVLNDETIDEKVDSIIFEIVGTKSNVDGVDSLTILSANGNVLFKIAEGGNLELLADTVMKVGESNFGIITLADYFQENQIFYVIYNPNDSVSLQSSRLYLPYIGLDITQYKQLDSITFAGDSLLIRSYSRPEISLSLALDTLICNRDSIINYYEFE